MSSLAKLKADKRIESVDTIDNVFVCLKPGWHWSQQRSFGCDTVAEAWKLTRQAEWDPDGYGRPDQ